MTADHPLERLAPEVKNYAAGPLLLQEDLDRLYRVQQVGAFEAVILYGARILEALTADALKAVELPTSPNVFANLDTLQQFNLIQAPALYWAHDLRRLGNLVRHVQRRVEPEDAELSALFVERCLEWFFCRFRYRPHRHLQRLTQDEMPFALTAGGELRPLIVALEAGDFEPEALLARAQSTSDRAFFRTPALAAAAAEVLLECGERDAARRLLALALDAAPDEPRLHQLMGLYWSREGNLDEARKWLEPLYVRYRDDDETAGITAGVYKRLWLADKAQTEWLARSHRAYLRGWKGSRETNAYLGINAATTALWLGRPSEARQLAEAVRQLLERRAAALRRFPKDTNLVSNYWEEVTLAEARLLLGEVDAAREAYLAAFAKHAGQGGNIAVSRLQLARILQALSPPSTVEEFLAGPQDPRSG